MFDHSNSADELPDPSEVTNGAVFRDWRQRRLPQLLKAGRLSDAIAVLDILLTSPLAGPRDRIELARLLGEAKDPRAIDAYVGLVEDATDASTISFGLSRLLQARKNGVAARLALNWPQWPRDDRLTTLGAQALARGGEPKAALNLLDSRGRAAIASQVEIHLRLLNWASRFDETVSLFKRAAKQGVDGVIGRSELAVALERLERRKEAVAAFGEVLAIEPNNVRALLRRGELHLALGNVRSAQDELSRALDAAPHLNKARVALARSFKASGKYNLCANLLLEALEQEPDNEELRRLTAAGLSQAGRFEKANQIYLSLIQRREKSLPDDLLGGMRRLEHISDDHFIPPVRLDWAWSLREASRWNDRVVWERKAKWGALADKLLFDWLVCRMDRIEETLDLLDDLGAAEEAVRYLTNRGRGLIVASAHIGVMFAGPLALELLGLENKWLASVPSVPSVGLKHSLISTADQTEGQVVRQSVRALAQGKVLTIAVDGTMSMAAPRINFEGQAVTYSSFAARLSFKQRAPSIFAVPRWQDDKIQFRLRSMPDPENATDIDIFLEKWRAAYFKHVSEMLRDEPQNLRFSGGLWRDLR